MNRELHNKKEKDKKFRFIKDYDWLNRKDIWVLRLGDAPFGIFGELPENSELIEYIANTAYKMGIDETKEKNKVPTKKEMLTEKETAFYLGISRSALSQSRMDGWRENRMP